MSKTLNDFTNKTAILGTDHLVGFSSTAAGGEFKITANNLQASLPGTVKAFGILRKRWPNSQAAIFNTSYMYNIQSITTPVPSSPLGDPIQPSDSDSIRIYFSTPVTQNQCVVSLATTKGEVYIGRRLTAQEGVTSLITQSSYFDVTWKNAAGVDGAVLHFAVFSN